MNSHKYITRLRKRGDWCIMTPFECPGYTMIHGYYPDSNSLCGCGTRCEPPRKHRDRITRRLLQREVDELIDEFQRGAS